VFERVLEADSRLLLARHHLADLYIDRGDTDRALQLLEDGLTLLDRAREDMSAGDYTFLPGITTAAQADQMEYLLRLTRGRAYLESNAPQQAKTNLRDAEDLFNSIKTVAQGTPVRANTAPGRADMSCGPKDDRTPYILGTELNLHYYLALTYDALCSDDATVTAAIQEWRTVRNGQPANSRQEAWRDEAVRRLSSGETCRTSYGGIGATLPGVMGLPGRE